MVSVDLIPVDESVLAALLEVARTGADPDEVTPPLSTDGRWTDERTAWFTAYHRRSRGGLDGPSGEAAWAVIVDGEPAGAIRLQRTAEPGVLETGVWLGRDVRGAGVGTAALRAALERAATAGARVVLADTAATNRAAQTVLKRVGFTLTDGEPDGRVHASIDLPPPAGTEARDGQ